MRFVEYIRGGEDNKLKKNTHIYTPTCRTKFMENCNKLLMQNIHLEVCFHVYSLNYLNNLLPFYHQRDKSAKGDKQ